MKRCAPLPCRALFEALRDSDAAAAWSRVSGTDISDRFDLFDDAIALVCAAVACMPDMQPQARLLRTLLSIATRDHEPLHLTSAPPMMEDAARLVRVFLPSLETRDILKYVKSAARDAVARKRSMGEEETVPEVPVKWSGQPVGELLRWAATHRFIERC
jgi:hypothetical protein